MHSNEKLTREMVFCLIFMAALGNIVYSHTWIDNATDRAAWLAAMAGIWLIIPIALWILYLGKLSPQTTVLEMVDQGMGKFIGGILCLLFIPVNILLAVAQLNMFAEMVKVFFLPLTPSLVIMISIALVSMLFISKGLMTFARLVEVLALFGMVNYFTSFAFAFTKDFQLYYVLPIFDTSILGFISGTVFIAGEAAECLLLLLIIVRYIPDPFKHQKWVTYAIGISGIVFALGILIIIGMLSPELAKRIAFGGVNAAKMLQIGEYIRGLEVFIFATYNFIAIGKVSVCLYCSWTALQKVFGNKKGQLQLYILTLLLLAPAIYINSYNKAYFLSVFLGRYVTLPTVVFILIIASVSIMIKKHKTGSATL